MKHLPLGGLNLDFDPQLVNEQGDYVDCHSLRPVGNTAGNTYSIQTILGNEYQFSMGSATVQSAILRIYIDVRDGNDSQFSFLAYNQLGALLGTNPNPPPTILLTSANLAANIGGVATAMENSGTNGWGETTTTSTSILATGYGYIDVTFGASNNNRTVLVRQNGVTDSDYYAEIRQEAYDSAIIGDFRPIGQYDLNGTTYILSTTFTTLLVNNMIGRISKITYNPITKVFTLTHLLTTKQWTTSVRYQADMRAERTNSRDAVYWTDNNNVIRAWYSNETYVYNTVDAQTTLLLRASSTIEWTETVQSGGALISGNKIYTARFYTNETDKTDSLPTTDYVNVYASDIGNANRINGGAIGTITNKYNIVTVTDIDTFTFTFIELGVVEFSGDSYSGTWLGKVAITSSIQELTHYGNEQDATEMDVAELSVFVENIKTAKNIEILNNRLLLSNITIFDELSDDFQAIADGITVSDYYLTEEMDSVQTVLSNTYGEFQDPNNVYNYASYQRYETYRFGIHFRKNGIWSKAYTGANLDHQFGLTPQFNAPWTDFKLYPMGASFANIDVSGLPDNGAGYEWQIVRLPLIPEVLGTGIMFPMYAENNVNFDSGLVPGLTGEFVPSSFNPAPLNYPTIATNYWWLLSPDWRFGGAPSRVDGDKLWYTTTKATYAAQGAGAARLFEISPRDITGAVNLDVEELVYLEGNGETIIDGNVTIKANTVYSQWNTANNVKFDEGYVANIPTGISYQWALTADPPFLVEPYYWFYVRELTDKYGDYDGNSFIPCGKVNPVTAGTTVYTDTVYGGDTFLQKTTWTTRLPIVATNDDGQNYTFYSENKVNSQMREEVFYPDTPLTLLEYLSQVEWDSNSYNNGYKITASPQIFAGYNSQIVPVTHLPARVLYSSLKVYGQSSDPYRVLLALNYYDLNASEGAINDMRAVNGFLYTLQDRSCRRLPYGLEAVISGQPTAEIYIGSGTVFSGKSDMITPYGTKHKWSSTKGKSDSSGKDIWTWVNTEFKKIMRLGSDGAVAISDKYNIRSFLANSLSIVDGVDNPCYAGGITTVWNGRFSEFIYVVRAGRNYPGTSTAIEDWGQPNVYIPGDVRHVTPQNAFFATLGVPYDSFEQTGNIYICKALTTVNIPADLSTYTLYAGSFLPQWTPIPHTNMDYYNEWNLVYNDVKKKFTQFDDYLPKIFISNGDNILSPHPQSGKENLIYCHNKGYYSAWYLYEGSSTGTLTTTDGVNITGNGTLFLTELAIGDVVTTVAVQGVVKYILSNTAMILEYSIGALTAIAFQSYRGQVVHPYIQFIDNTYPDESKNYYTQSLNTDSVPYLVEFDSEYGDYVFMNETEFTDRKGFFNASIRNNKSSIAITAAASIATGTRFTAPNTAVDLIRPVKVSNETADYGYVKIVSDQYNGITPVTAAGATTFDTNITFNVVTAPTNGTVQMCYFDTTRPSGKWLKAKVSFKSVMFNKLLSLIIKGRTTSRINT